MAIPPPREWRRNIVGMFVGLLITQFFVSYILASFVIPLAKAGASVQVLDVILVALIFPMYLADWFSGGLETITSYVAFALIGSIFWAAVITCILVLYQKFRAKRLTNRCSQPPAAPTSSF